MSEDRITSRSMTKRVRDFVGGGYLRQALERAGTADGDLIDALIDAAIRGA
jgi:hypothetical protein